MAQQRTLETSESSAFERDNAVGDVIFSIIQPSRLCVVIHEAQLSPTDRAMRRVS